jgi:hypothetical protein
LLLVFPEAMGRRGCYCFVWPRVCAVSQPSDLVAAVDAAVCGSEILHPAWAVARRWVSSFDAASWLPLGDSDKEFQLSKVKDDDTRKYLKNLMNGNAIRLGE